MSIRKLVLKISTLLLFSLPAGAITKVASTVALQVTTPLTVFWGEDIDGLAQVTASDGSAVTGTVTFYDGKTAFCTLTLTDGASCPAGSEKGFGTGTHVFTAIYSGDTTHAGGTSNAVTITVKQDSTMTALASSVNPVRTGGGVIYTATVTGAHGPVSGTVTFFDGTGTMGSAPLSASGTAALSVLMMTSGDHAVTAAFAGNANSSGSTSAVLQEKVQGSLAATTTTLSASANPATANTSIVFTAKVVATGEVNTAPAGAVTFVEGETALGSAMVKGGVATWSTTALSAGSHTIVAQYSGDGATAGSASPALTEIVNGQTGQGGSGGLTLGVDQVTVAAGDTALVPVIFSGGSGLAKAVSLNCSGLPEEASCLYTANGSGAATSAGAATLRIATSAPRDCGSSTPYGDHPMKSAVVPVAGLLLLLVPNRRLAKGLLTLFCAVFALGAMTGCGTGNCTDLGTRPGTYTITVTGSMGGAQISQKVKLVVTP